MVFIKSSKSGDFRAPTTCSVGHQALGRAPRALPSTNPYYQIASPHVVESGGIPDVASLQLGETNYFAASREPSAV